MIRRVVLVHKVSYLFEHGAALRVGAIVQRFVDLFIGHSITPVRLSMIVIASLVLMRCQLQPPSSVRYQYIRPRIENRLILLVQVGNFILSFSVSRLNLSVAMCAVERIVLPIHLSARSYP